MGESMRHSRSWISIAFAAALFVQPLAASAETQTQSSSPDRTPNLVVGIVVDQMRLDTLYRFWHRFGDDGFRKLFDEGFSFENASFDYMPTFTAPGHASIYTGTTPAVHGILANAWYVRELKQTTYVTDDPSVSAVGSESQASRMSPRWMLTTTIGDELWMHTNERAKVIGLALKDRSAILPASHTGAAYWLDESTGRFVTSTWYRDELPDWLKEFNARGLTERYLAQPWEPLLPLEEYVESLPDDNPYEVPFAGEDRPVFPHDLPTLARARGFGLVAYTPFGDELLTELALAALDGESLGRRDVPDLLSISYSAPDNIGHRFGPMSVEVQDTYLRLDRQIARLLGELEKRYGRDVLVFLTSDHGTGHVPGYLADRSIPVGEFRDRAVGEALRRFVEERYGDADLIEAFHNQQVFLDRERLRAAGIDRRRIEEDIAHFLLEQEGVAGAITGTALRFGSFSDPHRARLQRGFHPRRSGDVVVWMEPHWISDFGGRVAAMHGSPFSYDTRVPLVWYGWTVPAGRTTEPVHITDIAPTLAVFLRTPFPSGTTGTPINHLMRPAALAK
ncbi:MAG: alkaline phosphatase PafA [Gammaproteobacteria bacterium]